jgi:hypothetical protein
MLVNLITFKFIGVFEDIKNRLVNILSQKKIKISKTFVRYNSLPDSSETFKMAFLDCETNFYGTHTHIQTARAARWG